MPGQADVNAEHNSTGKSLVLVSLRDEQRVVNAITTDAGFLAHLIACRVGIAGYRKNRREEPSIASDRYRASAIKGTAASGPTSTTLKVA